MIPLSLREVADVVGGEVQDCAEPDAVRVTGAASVDSRAVPPGGLFAAFAGERADGHDFAAAAVEAGAAAALVSRPVGAPSVVVPDVRAALADLARHVLALAPHVTVLAVTGSQGKTSTKDLLTAVLAAEAPSVATQGSYNNELGLPLTVLRVEPDTVHLLLEMGARGRGHIRDLCAVARPDVSIVLNVGKAHLSEFGSQAGIAEAKGELVEALTADGRAVLNADDAWVRAMADRTRGQVMTFGRDPAADVAVGDLRLDDQGRPSCVLRHAGEEVPLRLRLMGEHQALNAAAAATAALAVGIPLARSCEVLGTVAGLSQWRMETHERSDGVLVVNDAYNANPDSMAAALSSLVAVGAGRRSRGGAGSSARTVAVLGEMRELGASSEEEHEEVGRLSVRLGVDVLVVVGPAAEGVARGAREASGGEEPVVVSDNDEAVAWLTGNLRAGDVVLLKASRGARLDEVAARLTAGEGEAR